MVVSASREREEAILEIPGQQGTVLQVLERSSLGVQQSLYSLDDLIAVVQERVEKFDMRRKRHLASTFNCHNAPQNQNPSSK